MAAMSSTYMACGHSAQAIDGNGDPVCVVCFGKPEARQVAEAPDLSTRKARCSYDKGNGEHRPGMPNRGYRAEPQPVESRTSLPFFKHHPDKPEDSYYCGCWGWD